VQHLAQSKKLCVPPPIPSIEFETLIQFQDRYWQLSPWLSGESDFEQRPSRERVEAMCQSLAVLHLEAAKLAVLQHQNHSEQREAQLAYLAQSLDAGELVANHEQLDLPANVSSSLRYGVSLVQQQASRFQPTYTSRQWIWGDAWPPNFLFADDRVVGLVDFAAVRVDTPVADLARLLGSAATDHPDWWQAGVDSYAHIRPLSPADRELTRHLVDVGTVVSLGNWLRWLVGESGKFANNAESRGRMHHFHRRLTELLARSVPR
jgi:Ser/Thr protein kinase RdoA (MazF antagonist)